MALSAEKPLRISPVLCQQGDYIVSGVLPTGQAESYKGLIFVSSRVRGGIAYRCLKPMRSLGRDVFSASRDFCHIVRFTFTGEGVCQQVWDPKRPAQFRHSDSSLFNRKQRTRRSRSNHPPTPEILRLYSITDRTERFLCRRSFNLFVFIVFFFVRYLTTPAAPARLCTYSYDCGETLDPPPGCFSAATEGAASNPWPYNFGFSDSPSQPALAAPSRGQKS